MIYEVPLTRREDKTVTVEATSRDEAYSAASKSNPGWIADEVIELREEGRDSIVHELYGACENCEKLIWHGDKYASDHEGTIICGECAEALTKDV